MRPRSFWSTAYLPCNRTASSALLRTMPKYLTRTLSTTSTLHKKPASQLPPRPSLPDSEIRHAYLKGSGPGGQKINKTSSAVQLTHIPTGIVVKSQATRSQSQNHTIARRILAEKIELLEKGGESRAAKVVERKRKKKASMAKKARRKYRKLGEGRGVEEVGSAAGTVGVSSGLELGDGEVNEEWEDVDEGEETDEDLEDDQDIEVEFGEQDKSQDIGHDGPARTGAEG